MARALSPPKSPAPLKKEGFRCGLYTSPHLSCFRERIQINGQPIAEKEVERLLPPLLELAPDTSFFEITTLLAFCYFAEKQVDWAVIEVGIGGRLDATNLIHPKLALITSISLEHTEILGPTLEEIAAEKGGILKPGVPAVIGPRAPPFPGAEKISGSFKTYDEENSATAKRGLELLGLSPAAIDYGLTFRPPCRAEWASERILLDVAHNPDGIQQLIRLLNGQKAHFVIAFSKTKDIASCLAILLPQALSFTLTEASNGRSFSPQELQKELLRQNCQIPIDLISNPREATTFALQKEGLIVITGSFFIMADAKAAIESVFSKL